MLNLVNRIFSLKTTVIDKAALILNLIIILTIIFIPDNMIELRKIYSIGSFFIVFIFIYIFIRTLQLKNKSHKAKMFLTALILVFYFFQLMIFIIRFFFNRQCFISHITE